MEPVLAVCICQCCCCSCRSISSAGCPWPHLAMADRQQRGGSDLLLHPGQHTSSVLSTAPRHTVTQAGRQAGTGATGMSMRNWPVATSASAPFHALSAQQHVLHANEPYCITLRHQTTSSQCVCRQQCRMHHHQTSLPCNLPALSANDLPPPPQTPQPQGQPPRHHPTATTANRQNTHPNSQHRIATLAAKSSSSVAPHLLRKTPVLVRICWLGLRCSSGR